MAQVSRKTTVYLNDELMERIDELGIKLSPFIQRVYLRYREVVAENTVRLTREEKDKCCKTIAELKRNGAPIFNLTNAFPYIVDNSFPAPCRQCVVIENGKLSVCGRCIDVPELCSKCGYFFVAEYTLLFRGNLKIIIEMLRTYLKYI